MKGMEAIIHALRVTKTVLRDQDKVILKVELTNVFSQVEHSSFLGSICEHALEAVLLVQIIYGRPFKPYFGPLVLQSANGTH